MIGPQLILRDERLRSLKKPRRKVPFARKRPVDAGVRKAVLAARDLFWRRRRVILVATVAIPALALLSLVLTGPRFSATAGVKVLLAGRSGDGTQIASPELSSLVSSEARMLSSRNLARNVAARLRLDEGRRPGLKARIDALTYALTGSAYPAADPLDAATNALQSALSVQFEPRSYYIDVSYSARTPEEAARVANAVASEYLAMRNEQVLGEGLAAAERVLNETRLQFGPKHPQSLAAALKTEAAREALVQAKTAKPMTAPELSATGRVIPAIANTTATSPAIAIAVALGLVAGLGLGVAASLLLEAWSSRRSRRFKQALARMSGEQGQPPAGAKAAAPILLASRQPPG